ncbi:MAG: hypothetical protein CR984_00015 [Proteobacteria bacterium]|nr:MAG: hypothetical protein CR984_00015 [Pseudomonadota bacterium]
MIAAPKKRTPYLQDRLGCLSGDLFEHPVAPGKLHIARQAKPSSRRRSCPFSAQVFADPQLNASQIALGASAQPRMNVDFSSHGTPITDTLDPVIRSPA